jgi:hypothetical protein
MQTSVPPARTCAHVFENIGLNCLGAAGHAGAHWWTLSGFLDEKRRTAKKHEASARCIAVYFPNESHPAFKATEEEANRWMHNGLAILIKRRGWAIRLKKKAASPEVHDQSCKMGKTVMQGIAIYQNRHMISLLSDVSDALIPLTAEERFCGHRV